METTRARRQKSRRKTKKRINRIRPRNLRTPNRPPLRRRSFVGRRHHRSCPYARRLGLGPRSRRPQSRYPRIQDRSPSNLTEMRKRGLIIVAATVPAWGILFYLASEFEKENRIWEYEASPPLYLIGGGWAIVLTTLAGLALLLVDHISWRRQQNDRTNKTH